MKKGIAVLNSGSSSIKFSMYEMKAGEDLQLAFRGLVERIRSAPRFSVRAHDGTVIETKSWPMDSAPDFAGLLTFILDWIERYPHAASLSAVGHRVVHGGPVYSSPIRVVPEVMETLATFEPWAPLHQPFNLEAIRAISRLHPGLPQVACFDTAFHKTIPAVAQAFAVPRWLQEEGVRRYGFHGLSYEYIAQQLPRFDARAAQGRTVVAHLGNGASMCALKKARSVASSMGFSAIDGLAMGTRSGALDPGVLLYLMQAKKMNAKELETLLYRESGLLGVSGISNDMRTLLASSDSRAEEALAIYVYRIQRELGALAASLGGLDALVFTAGVGENAAQIRERVCSNAGWPEIRLDPEANERHGPRITTQDSPVAVWVIPTNEELTIARHTLAVLDAA